eukprot:scaffold521_cov167-Amphora_coffeaeformis.AAC.30
MSPKSTDLETQAAELLRTVDFAASELNQTALDAAREQEEARQNARLAAAMIRRYSTRPTAHSRQQQQQSSPISISKSTSASSSSPSPPRMTAQGKLLSMGLELERCQRDLAEEKEAHQATQEALQTVKTQAKQYAAEVQDLLHQQETLREEMGRRNDELQRELNTNKQRLEAAEQDANLALELATNNNAAREEMEVWYQQCLERNQVLELAMEEHNRSLLQNHAHHDTTLPALRNDENSTPPETSNNTTTMVLPKKSANAMVASGRRLLDDFRGKNKAQQTTDPKAIAERSHERRRQLTDRLKLMDTTTTATTSVSTSTALVVPTQASDTFARISKLLKESGRRLSLPGRWWKKKADTTNETHEPVSPEDTENLTKHFCQAVEVSYEKEGDDCNCSSILDHASIISLCTIFRRAWSNGKKAKSLSWSRFAL